MKIALFDLGHTLEADGVLLPGAHHALQTVQRMCVDGEPVRLALLSDYRMPNGSDGVQVILAEYFRLLEQLGLQEYFIPLKEHVTLSTELGVFKPNPKLFRFSVDKILPGIPFEDVTFVTENGSHVAAARALGMVAFQVHMPGSPSSLLTLPKVPAQLAKAYGISLVETSGAEGSVHLARTRAESADPICGRSTTWVQLGKERLLVATGTELEDVARIEPSIAPLSGETLKRDHLQVIHQKGRLFQRFHPGVEVLYDVGRFLIVDMPPEEVRQPDPHGHSHFEISPLSENEVLFSLADTAAIREAPDFTIQSALDELQLDGFKADLEGLVQISTRHSLTDGYNQALEFARDRLKHYSTRVQSFTMPGGNSANLIADKIGTASSDRDIILVTAHLDSVNLEDGQTALAPGADDNGSGAAGLLAIGRALRNLELRHDVRLILFGGEEQGLFGSREYLSQLTPLERRRIRAVLNMDMIGAQNGLHPGVLLESSPTALWLLRELSKVAATYTELEVQISTHPFASDHVSFLNAGIPAVLTIEAADEQSQDFVHSSRDTLEHINYEQAMNILRMNTAWIIHASRT